MPALTLFVTRTRRIGLSVVAVTVVDRETGEPHSLALDDSLATALRLAPGRRLHLEATDAPHLTLVDF